MFIEKQETLFDFSHLSIKLENFLHVQMESPLKLRFALLSMENEKFELKCIKIEYEQLCSKENNAQ